MCVGVVYRCSLTSDLYALIVDNVRVWCRVRIRWVWFDL